MEGSAGAGLVETGAGGVNNPTNFFLMLEAAAPETCCAMIPLARLAKGEMGAASPAGAKMAQGWAAMTGARRGSVAMRCAQASARRVVVVVVGGGRVLEGMVEVAGAPGLMGGVVVRDGYVVRRLPRGVMSGALVV